MALISPGELAPDFTLDSHLEEPVTLSDYRDDMNVLLVSYPLDFTPT
ncbi:redoxin domain-containing protein [bacterium]|nr:redoxin domain-containing protein [bacterium]